MAIFTRKKASIGTQLANKGTELRNKQAAQASASDSFIQAAHAAQEASKTADTHATAVEQALGILNDAGVAL